jgi:type IV fimbrial biogenesis protein FimT
MKTRGFTLIELMVVVAIVAILAAVAAPSFANLIRSNRLAGASSALQVSLNVARSEAVKRGADARVTVAANGTAGQWTNGWTVFVDRTTNANGGVAPADDSNANAARLEVVASPSTSLLSSYTGSINSFTYNGQGRLIDVSGGGVVNRSLWFYQGDSERYCLVLSNSGRVRVARTASAVACPSD